MSVTIPNPAFAGPPPSGVQARLQYQQQRRNAVAQYTQPAAVMSASYPLMENGEYESDSFTLPQGTNRITLQATFNSPSNNMRIWLATPSGTAIANLSPSKTVRVSVPVGTSLVVKAKGGEDDSISAYTVFASYERA